MKKILFFSILLLLSACSNPEMEKQLAETKASLEAAEATIQKMEASQANTIVHTLYFTLKEGISTPERTQFVSLLQELGELTYVNQIKIGTPADVPDPRAKRDYDYAMEMQFANKDQLLAYQQDSKHLAIRAKAGPLLGGPPVVYDFEVLN